MPTDIKDFFSAFSHNRNFFLHLPVLWTVTIDGVDKESINNTLIYGGEKWRATVSPTDMTSLGNILVAQSVNLPNETSGFTPMDSGGTMGGYLPSSGLVSRSNFLDRGLSVNFLETEGDLEHNFLRPWIIAIGIKGLIEEGVQLKANMTVKQFTNSGKLIKGFKFRKVFPTAVESYVMDYVNTDFRIKSVTFGCENYEQIQPQDKEQDNFFGT